MSPLKARRFAGGNSPPFPCTRLVSKNPLNIHLTLLLTIIARHSATLDFCQHHSLLTILCGSTGTYSRSGFKLAPVLLCAIMTQNAHDCEREYHNSVSGGGVPSDDDGIQSWQDREAQQEFLEGVSSKRLFLYESIQDPCSARPPSGYLIESPG